MFPSLNFVVNYFPVLVTGQLCFLWSALSDILKESWVVFIRIWYCLIFKLLFLKLSVLPLPLVRFQSSRFRRPFQFRSSLSRQAPSSEAFLLYHPISLLSSPFFNSLKTFLAADGWSLPFPAAFSAALKWQLVYLTTPLPLCQHHLPSFFPFRHSLWFIGVKIMILVYFLWT